MQLKLRWFLSGMYMEMTTLPLRLVELADHR